jgi:hypothetical protein
MRGAGAPVAREAVCLDRAIVTGKMQTRASATLGKYSFTNHVIVKGISSSSLHLFYFPNWGLLEYLHSGVHRKNWTSIAAIHFKY